MKRIKTVMTNQTPHKSNKTAKILLLTLFLLGTTLYSKAQLTPFQNMYFQNKYIYNPAMAGLSEGLNINANYRQQWSNFPGTPKTGLLTADLHATDKVGLGLNVTADEAGLIKSTRVMGTYAYHLQLAGENQHLSFGLSLGVSDSRVKYSLINGDPTDPEISRYNQLKPYLDGDFGVAYTSNSLYIGAAMPNMKSTFSRNSDERLDVNKPLFIGIVSYKIPVGDGGNFKLEPLAGLRVIKGNTDIIDVGANLNMDHYGLFFQTIYHSSQSLGFGCGLDQQNFGFNISYNIETGPLTTYTNGTFEVGVKLKLFNKKAN
ncbi:type IX secretion system PorP/SprF family membrane protein [Pedobacter cryoconitis]|uniref:Type IX secretion system PorP/SprF family membrane protein n=1 Tax=Pedobacter cryoconitis TaxID=188932 RepID=A0A7W9DJ23_9SPHI|nr:PorP/SprF family type IX secretion system membrane protein [Pedobacter cryoconitis]MBB5620737.1 type IX secretion system PorP/SprF family membrane protein [Pedobacter cryoconitis]